MWLTVLEIRCVVGKMQNRMNVPNPSTPTPGGVHDGSHEDCTGTPNIPDGQGHAIKRFFVNLKSTGANIGRICVHRAAWRGRSFGLFNRGLRLQKPQPLQYFRAIMGYIGLTAPVTPTRYRG